MRNQMMYSGIITNYNCSAACRHCMFASSPRAGKEFMTAEAAERIARRLKEAGAASMHIGGGEPFLNFEALCILLKAMKKYGVGVDYIETNAFWAQDDDGIMEKLRMIRALGADTVMVSIDPFHIEYVPLERPIRLIQALRRAGMDYFVWQDRFLERLLPLDLKKTHTKEELAALLGEDYIEETAREYGVKVNGRALTIAKNVYEPRQAEELLDGEPCRNLLSGMHCHIDLHEMAIPSGCPGISIGMDDFFKGRLNEERYPAAYRLYTGGVRALYEYAKEAGFAPDENGYATKCSLCCAIRTWLNENKHSPDIAPDCFYREMKRAMEESNED